MSKEMTVVALGVWVVIVPYLGVPGSWRTAILVLSGIGIALVGLLLRGERLARGGTESRSFAESAPESYEQKEGITSFN